MRSIVSNWLLSALPLLVIIKKVLPIKKSIKKLKMKKGSDIIKFGVQPNATINYNI